MTQIFVYMLIIGGMTFIGFGQSSSFSIETSNTQRVKNTLLSIITSIGALLFLIGMLGLIIN